MNDLFIPSGGGLRHTAASWPCLATSRLSGFSPVHCMWPQTKFITAGGNSSSVPLRLFVLHPSCATISILGSPPEERNPPLRWESDLQWITDLKMAGNSFHIVGIGYLYLLDWALTIVAVYALVVALSPLEPRNIFTSVEGALRDFVRRRRVFLFSGYFWQHNTHPPRSSVSARDEKKNSVLKSMPQLIHEQTLELDGSLRGAWQGNNCRVALVYQAARANGPKADSSYCFHYRRFGKSSFIVAVNSHAEHFDGSNAKSQPSPATGESIGYLVNVRNSLR